MGKTKYASVSSRSLLLTLLLPVITSCVHTISIADTTPPDLVMQFLTNAYTGKSMRAPDWLQKAAREAKQFEAFGGVDALVRQSTALAREYGGLKSVEILDVQSRSGGYEIRAEVKFFEDAKRRKSPAAAEREDMSWTFHVVREEGRWLLSY